MPLTTLTIFQGDGYLRMVPTQQVRFKRTGKGEKSLCDNPEEPWKLKKRKIRRKQKALTLLSPTVLFCSGASPTTK